MTKANGTAVERTFKAPNFDRLNYFYGQMLGVGDFCAEQSFFREKMKLHNRCLHGFGIVCGLLVSVPKPEPECKDLPKPKPDCKDPHEKPLFYLEPGMALDQEGNELIVRTEEQFCNINIWELLGETDRQTIAQKLGKDKDAWFCEPVYVCLHYSQCALGPSQPITVDSCGGTLPKVYGKIRDSVRVSVTLKKPDEDKRCETCCCEGPCACDGLLITRIDKFHPHKSLKIEDIHNEVRRRVGTYTYTTIAGVNWQHGREYSRETVRHLLRDGFVIHFSKPVWIDPFHQRGVVDVYQIETRSIRHPNIIELRGEISPCAAPTTFLRYRITQIEDCPETCDRLFIVVRCGFILDECCRPVDGVNVGGRIPQIGNEFMPCVHEKTKPENCVPCEKPPWGYTPWTSGNGTGGGTFESWIYLEERKGVHHERE